MLKLSFRVLIMRWTAFHGKDKHRMTHLVALSVLTNEDKAKRRLSAEPDPKRDILYFAILRDNINVKVEEG